MVLNEKEYAIKVLETHHLTEDITSTLFILAKYYHQILNYETTIIIEKLDNFMCKVYMDYNKVSWLKLFERSIKSAQKYKLIEVDYIPITENELSTIKMIPSEQEKRVVFSMLCFAKYYNLVNSENNGWVNTDSKIIFKASHVQKDIEEQDRIYCKLKENGYITISKKISTLNRRITFIDDKSKIILKITDLRDLGYEYLYYSGANYIRCAQCGRLTKNNAKNNKKYCAACNKYEAIKTKLKICVDCKKDFLVLSKNNQSDRCEDCYQQHRQRKKLENQRLRRSKNPMKSEQSFF